MQTTTRKGNLYPQLKNSWSSSYSEMAHHHEPSILLPLLLITLSLISCKEVFASHHLLEEPTLPKVPELPKPEVPTLPKVELPPLPYIPEPMLPTLPKPELPAVPALEKPELPPLPKLEEPKLPELPPLLKPTLPTLPTLPKAFPFPSFSPPYSTTTP